MTAVVIDRELANQSKLCAGDGAALVDAESPSCIGLC